MLASLVLQQRTDVMQRFSSTNFETGKLVDEPDRAKHAWVLQQLQLSEQQVSSIAHSMSCFKRLLAPGVQERQQLQQELSQQQDLPGAVSSSSSIDSYKQSMTKREAMLARLSNSMRKEYMLRMAAAAAIAGSLTFVQLATAIVQMTPHCVALQMLGMLVLEQQEEQERQQQQQEAGCA
jgi:hypothetical protein